MGKYGDKGYCSLCGKWIAREDLLKVYIPKLKVYAYYCPVHRKQTRLKSRRRTMNAVKI